MVGMSKNYTGGKSYTLPEDFQYTNLQRQPWVTNVNPDALAMANSIGGGKYTPQDIQPATGNRLPAQQSGWGNYQGQMPNYTGRTYNAPNLKTAPSPPPEKEKMNAGDLAMTAGKTYATNAAKNYLKEQAAPAAAKAGAEGATGGVISEYAPYVGMALTAANAGRGIYNVAGNDNMTGDEQATRMQQKAALGVADYFTYGLASPAEGYARGQWGGTMKKIDKLDQATNPGTMVLSSFLNGKGKDQMARDRMRNGALRDLGILGPDKNKWDVTLADGSTFDVGRDGNNPAKLYNIDMSDPVNAETATQARLFSQILSGGDQKTATQWGAILGNAAVSNAGGDQAKATANLKAAVADKFIGSGMNAEHAGQILDEQLTKGSITQEEHDALASKIPLFFGGGKASGNTQTSSGKGAKKPKKKAKARPQAEEPRFQYKTPPVLPGPGTLMPQPARISPEDYARAIADVYRQNQGR